MREVTWEADNLYTRGLLHDSLAIALGLGAGYGHNLQALYDVLVGLREDMQLTVHGSTQLTEQMGEYGARILQTMRHAAMLNPHFILLEA